MSGTQIPMEVRPFDPFIGNQKELANEATQAGIGQTQAQTGLIGEQATAAGFQNQLMAARIPALQAMYGAYSGAMNGGGFAGGAPGNASGGPPGAIGASGNSNWTGPDGIILPPGVPGSELGSIPRSWLPRIISAEPAQLNKTLQDLRVEKNAYVNQAIAGTIDPATGQADPAKWNQMVQDELQSGWMDAQHARLYYGHPELAQTVMNATMAVQEQPGTRQAQAGASAAGAAPYDLVKTTRQNPDGTWQEVYVPKSTLVGGGTGGQQGGGALPADLTTNIQRASQVYNVPANDLMATAKVESGGQSGATSKTGAAGSFQFTGGTASDMGVTNPRDNRQASLGAARLYVENRAALTDSLGRPPASSEIYLAHQQGADGAAALIQAPPTMLAVDALKQAGISPRNVLVNGGTPTMTAGDFVKKWQTAFNQAAGRPTAPTDAGASPTTQIPPTGQAPALGGGAVAAAGAPQFSPGVQAARAIDAEHIKADDALNQSNLDAAQKSLQATVGLREARDLVANVPTGAFIDQRVALQSAAQQTGSPLLSRISTAVTGLSPQQLNDAEFARKLYQNNVVAQEQAVGNVRIGAMFTNFYAKASPNLSLQNGALNEMTNAALVGSQMVRDFANGSDAYTQAAQAAHQQKLATNQYEPYQPLRNYEATWTAAGSPHAADTYAAAVHILNGAPITQAVKGLSPAQVNEAVDVIARADPGAMPKLLARPDVQAWRRSLQPAAQ